MKRWMENKVGRQRAYSKLVNGKSERFAPTSKVATRLVAYVYTPKPASFTDYDASMVRRIEPEKKGNVKPRKAYDDGKRTWSNGSVVERAYDWSTYAGSGGSRLIRAS